MLIKIVKNIALGKGIVGVSLPIRLFEPRGSLERIAT